MMQMHRNECKTTDATKELKGRGKKEINSKRHSLFHRMKPSGLHHPFGSKLLGKGI